MVQQRWISKTLVSLRHLEKTTYGMTPFVLHAQNMQINKQK